MPGYHVTVAALSTSSGSMLLESMRPGEYKVWDSDQPLFGLPLPIDGYEARQERLFLSPDELLEYLRNNAYQGRYYVMRIYRN